MRKGGVMFYLLWGVGGINIGVGVWDLCDKFGPGWIAVAQLVVGIFVLGIAIKVLRDGAK
jgi:hypothetical protein